MRVLNLTLLGQAAAFDKLQAHLLLGPKSIDVNHQLINRIFPNPEKVMKAMVEKVYKKILKPFLDEVEVATKKESKHAYLRATEQAFVTINSIEKKLERYDMADLDIHSLTSELFPELKPGASTTDDYIDIELSDLRERFAEIREQASYGAQDYFHDLSELQKDGSDAKEAVEENQDKLDLLALTVDTVATHMFSAMINETKAALTRALKLSTEDERQENSKKISQV